MANLSQERREKLLNYIDRLKELHNDDADMRLLNELELALTEKKYGLVWEEHTEQVDEMLENNVPIFVEDESKLIKNDESNGFNFLLEGDNLHSLKLLQKTHKEKIDVIYIDPPYNRGKNDFIYDDKFVVKEDGYKHSKWISFMEKRLKIAKKLLKSDGLFFISIDDNEFAQLKLLLDDIFGETNFINCFIWKRNSSSKTDKSQFTVNSEYIYLYSKTREYFLNDTYKPLSDSTIKLYNKNDGDGRGNYRLYPLQKPGNPGPETSYDYIDNNGKIWKCPAKGWRIKESKMRALENDNRLVLTNKTLSEKAYWNERKSKGRRIDTLWVDLPENTVGSSELEKVLGVSNTFDNPKPTKLIQRCLEVSGKNAIVLDFFAGSGTTGHAVQALNKEDGGNRKYILCTNNENNICEEVTYKRLTNIQEELPHNLKYFKTEFIPKLSDEEHVLSAELLQGMKELVELENMTSIDGMKKVLVLNDDDLSKLNEIEKDGTLYISTHVLLSREEEIMLQEKNVAVIDIPDYYYLEELIEAGER